MKKTTFSIILLLFLVSCKSSKNIVGNDNSSIKTISAKQAISNHYNKVLDFNTLVSKLKVNYEDEQNTQNISVSLRMEKDKKIWISASLVIPLAKALITPERVRYYNKIDKIYFDGDYTLLSNWLGFELDFHQLQSLLLGEAMFDMNAEKHKLEIYDQSYLIQPKKQLEVLERLFLMNPNHFKMDSQQFAQNNEARLLNIDYTMYQEIEKQIVPKAIQIIATDTSKQTKLDIDFRSVSLNQELRFPFSIPDHYKEIKF